MWDITFPNRPTFSYVWRTGKIYSPLPLSVRMHAKEKTLFFLPPPTTDVSERINEISVLPICMVLTTVYMPVFNTTLYALVHLCNVLVFLKPHPNDSEVAKIQPNIFGQHN